MLWSSSFEFAMLRGGPLTKRFLNALVKKVPQLLDDSVLVDTRTHMLMKGMYPCIPGWHHDFVDRHKNGQPYYGENAGGSDIVDIGHRKFYMGLAGANVSATQFYVGTTILSKNNWPAVYKRWDDEMNEQDTGRIIEVEDNNIYEFNQLSMHRGVPANKRGWRWSIRVSSGCKESAMNEIRNQVQVYLPTINQGW